jgi:dihydrofolate reductase
LGKLAYIAITSLDGYIEDESGNFDWAVPDDEVHAFINDLMRPIGTYLFGRRMYETMAVWENMGGPEDTEIGRDFSQIWRAAEKVVYSTSLRSTSTAKTRIERSFDPTVVRMQKSKSECDLAVAGANLAAQAFAGGLLDECRLFVNPVIVGGGKRALPSGVRVNARLESSRRFGNGVVYLQYSICR